MRRHDAAAVYYYSFQLVKTRYLNITLSFTRNHTMSVKNTHGMFTKTLYNIP